MAAGDLITLSYAQSALSELPLSAAQLTYLPPAITAASGLVVRYCGDRDFVQQSYDRIFGIGLDGTVSLPQIPVLKVSRVSGGRTQALLIANTDRAANQQASVEYAATGDVSIGITYTGLTLTTVASGTTTATTLLFATYPTLTTLAAAVTALGSGWSATVTSGYEPWASAELIAEDDAAQDGFAGAELYVWGERLANCRLDKRTGILSVTTGAVLNVDGPRWGPGWELFALDERESYSKVRVAYTAGFVTVPAPVQQAAALTVAALLSSLSKDPRLSSESDGTYSYVVNTAFADLALPKEAIGLLNPYVLHHA